MKRDVTSMIQDMSWELFYINSWSCKGAYLYSFFFFYLEEKKNKVCVQEILPDGSKVDIMSYRFK